MAGYYKIQMGGPPSVGLPRTRIEHEQGNMQWIHRTRNGNHCQPALSIGLEQLKFSGIANCMFKKIFLSKN